MKRIFIFAFILSVCVFLPAYAGSQFYNPIGKGCTNAFYIDKDCDGYGVASPLGVDADDNDPEVNTPETVIAKYGTLENFLHHLGYYPDRIFYISTNGDDSTGEVDNINKPYKTWDAVESQLQPGDAVIFREGKYDYLGNYAITCEDLKGTASKPIIVMAYPGEKSIIDSMGNTIGLSNSDHLIIDGFVLDSTQNPGLAHGLGGGGPFTNLIVKNIESRHHSGGWRSTENLHNILVENCVFHDNLASHGLYLGAREHPNSNITVRNCIMYRNGRHGFQHNGRVENLVVENCIMHSNTLGGISLLDGVHDSIFRNNLIFNNMRPGIILFVYPPDHSGCKPYNIYNNLFENNLIWIGKYRSIGETGSPADVRAVLFNDDTEEQNFTFTNNIFRNNIFVTYDGVIFDFREFRHLPSTVIENNVFYKRTTGAWAHPERIMSSKETDGTNTSQYGSIYYWDFDAFQNKSNLIKRNVFQDPKFTNVSIDYNLNPEKFNFDYLSNSSVRDFGTPVDAPSIDLRGIQEMKIQMLVAMNMDGY